MSDSSQGDGRLTRLARTLGLLVAARTAWRTARRVERPAPPAEDGGEPDPSERTVPASRRAEAVVAALLVAATCFACTFIAFYIVFQTRTELLGPAIGLALLCLAAAAIVAGKFVVPQEISVEPRDVLLKEEAAEEVVEIVQAGGEGISRRGLLTVTGGLAGAAMVGAAAAPVASLGPPSGILHQSPWKRGIRLVDDTGRVYAASEIHIGTYYTALPEGGNTESLGAGLLVVRLPVSMIHLPPGRHGWAPNGILAYSKICPHAGCAINLYRYPLDSQTASFRPAFTCPCHYSTFLAGDGGKLVFGPAGRELPQLPLMIDADGNLRCAGPFNQDIGPSWWGVRRT